MGILNKLGNFFNSSSKNATVIHEEDEYRKSVLATKIVNLVDKIKRINSLDSSIWNLSNVSSYDLERKSLHELEELYSSLNNRLSLLNKQNERKDVERESLEASKWTGQKPKDLTNHEFDRLQRYDGR